MTDSTGSAVMTPMAIVFGIMLVYGLPSMIAIVRYHYLTVTIVATNILLGWTVVGWIIALVLACGPNTGVRQQLSARMRALLDEDESDIETSVW